MERVTEDLRTADDGGADRDALAGWMDRLLESGRFSDYGPNGLQVEGRTRVRRIVSGVTASLALIEAAAADGADAIVVHHGLFWRGQDGRVTGWMKRRLAALLAHDISLYAYHLPLDAHPTPSPTPSPLQPVSGRAVSCQLLEHLGQLGSRPRQLLAHGTSIGDAQHQPDLVLVGAAFVHP